MGFQLTDFSVFFRSFSALTTQKAVRNPFNRYLGLDYDVDSEEEWDSEPEGEDLMDSNSEEEEEALEMLEEEENDGIVVDLKNCIMLDVLADWTVKAVLNQFNQTIRSLQTYFTPKQCNF